MSPAVKFGTYSDIFSSKYSDLEYTTHSFTKDIQSRIMTKYMMLNEFFSTCIGVCG